MLLDEWQEVPQVLGAVKRACDTEPRPGRFILTGSIRAEVETETWPGTGRVLYHLRQHHGRHEIDVIAELDSQHLLAFEIKATAAPSRDDARHLIWLRDHLGDQLLTGVVLHTGPSAFVLSDRIWALPISSLWKG